MKAIAIRPEVINTIGDPLKVYGISLSSMLSRILASSTIAMVKPTAVPKPFATLKIKLYSF